MKATNPFRLVAALIAAVMLTHTANRVVAATTNDLRAEWSDSQNPNGVWSYNQGTAPLPHENCFLDSCRGSLFACIPAWGFDGCGGVGWCEVPPSDITNVSYYHMQAGDIVMYSGSEGNVTWTAPTNGFASISGGVWAAATLARGNHWELYHNQTRLTMGDISEDPQHSRSMPFDFRTGTGGPEVLRNLYVSVGDIIKLKITKTTSDGTLAGVNLTVVSSPEPIEELPRLTIEVSHVRVCWSTQSNRTYQVQYRSELTTNAWVDLGAPMPGNGTTNCVTDAVAGPRRFYQVTRLP